MFQSTHPRGVRRQPIGGGAVAQAVSIHAPAWGATPKGVCSEWHPLVSIHAPAWGATAGRSQRMHRVAGVSIHAPAWGATMSCGRQVRWQVLFQSTHPRGVRLRQRPPVHRRRSRFNPRTRVGCDTLLTLPLGQAIWSFNPRTRVGCDGHAAFAGKRIEDCFNPRTRVGCDVLKALAVHADLAKVSIHAPAWGATGF